MPKKRKSLDLSDYCRVCLSKDDCMADLFLPDIFTKIKEVASSATVEINDTTNDGLPRNICHICLHKLEEWFDFKSQFIKTSKELVDYVHGNSDFSDHKKRKIEFELPTLEPVININEENNQEDIDTLPKIDDNNTKIGPDSTSGSQLLQNTSPTTRSRQLGPRKTNEQRLASTQRWEARKKALLAATGEDDSDTDTIPSDETQLSPIQKARAKNNAQKDVDYQKNLTNTMNNLGKTEAEKLSSSIIIDLTTPEIENKKDNNENISENIVNSELVIGDETFIITSTLTSTNSNFVNNVKINDLPMLLELNQKDIERQNNEEKREMLDAMQLRPVNNSNNNSVKNCMTLQVVAIETESLTRMQSELTKFLNDDMKKKIDSNEFLSDTKVILKKPNDSYQTLDQKLKNLIENTIKKNIDKNKIIEPGNSYTSEFIKAAEKSIVFQPKVLLDRIEPIPSYNSNKKNELTIKKSPSINKNIIDKKNPQTLPVIPSSTKKSQTTKIEQYIKQFENYSSISSSNNTNNNGGNDDDDDDDDDNEVIDISMNNTTMIDESSEETSRHVCGDCGAVFSTKEEVKQHFDEHNNELKKPKVKRCKRCKVIVDAELVKTHVCRNKITHNCLTCNTTFKTDKMLEKHMKIHKDEHINIERVNNLSIDKKNIDKIYSKSGIINDDSCKNNIKFDCYICDKIFDNEIILKNHLQDHINTTAVKTDGIPVDKQQAGNSLIEMTINTTQHELMTTQKLEEILAESSDNINTETTTTTTTNNNNKLQFSNDYFDGNDKPAENLQDEPKDTILCGMCLLYIPTGDAEKHITEHLVKEGANESNKSNVINNDGNDLHHDNQEEHSFSNENNIIEQSNVKNETKVLLYDCVQCNEKFESEKNLDQHMTTHEEDTVYDEFEDHQIKSQNKHLCTICNSSFENENSLAEHLDNNCDNNSTTCGICNEKLPNFEEFESHVAEHFT
ncbi:hypothetical protein HCN44_010456 [Aphidius gifuensis]|uniref:Uncharacterized protein n=1 Tax=Aphidius gifuensis TaxID=684658 RepID=A0A835CSV4_APHGI|nr:hypothetical protein HCN44_010456 [Aphidius gifuensis]